VIERGGMNLASTLYRPLPSAEHPGKGSLGAQELTSLGVHIKGLERPTEEREAQKILSQAYREKWTVFPCGGGTSLGVGPLPESVDMALDMTGMNPVLAFDPQNLNLAVYAGMTLDQINEYLGEQGKGFFLPLDPPFSQRATIGGVYAANASGPSRLRYGTMRDQVLGVRGVDAKGQEVGFGGKTVKNVSGYDLTKFFIGSAGSLCLITALSVRIYPLPEMSSLCDLIFGGLEELEKFLASLRSSVLVPSAVVVTDLAGGPGVSESPGLRYRSLVSFEGHGQAVERQNRDLLKLGEKFGGRGEAKIGREAMLRDLGSVVNPARLAPDILSMRVTVPIAQGPPTFESVVKILRNMNLLYKAALYAGNGVISLFAEGVSPAKAARLVEEMKGISQRAGGYVTPIYGHRRSLAHWGARVEPAVGHSVLRPIKEKLDPAGIFPPIV